MSVTTMGEVTLVAVFDGCGREGREGCSSGVRGASEFPHPKSVNILTDSHGGVN